MFLFMQVGKLRSSSAITLDLYDKGIALRPKIFFRPFMPPVFIPFPAINDTEFAEALFGMRIFRAKVEGVTLEIHTRNSDVFDILASRFKQ